MTSQTLKQMRGFELRSGDRLVIRFDHEITSLISLSCVFVETFEIFIYICAGLKMQCNLIPYLPVHQQLAASLNH
jgi:hypothetical protein